MKRVELPLSKLSLSQKLDLMETLWSDLTRDESSFKSPDWHEPILKEREKAHTAGRLTSSSWSEAKARIRKKVS